MTPHRVAAGLGLLFSMLLGGMAVLQISTLQDEGESLGNQVGPLVGNLTDLSVLFFVAVIGGGGLVMLVGVALHALGHR